MTALRDLKNTSLDDYLGEVLPSAITTPGGEIFGPEHLHKAVVMYESDRIKELNNKEIFKTSLSSILSAGERYDKQIRVFKNLLLDGLDNPESIIANAATVEFALKSSRYPNKKARKICEFAEWWLESSFGTRIISDLKTGKIDEFRIRDDFAENAPGIGYKIASLIADMCGYENVVPLDIWALRFLMTEGKPVRVPDYIKTGGPKGQEYKTYEKYFSDIARDCNLSPAWLQRILWVKYSSWTKSRNGFLYRNNTRTRTLESY